MPERSAIILYGPPVAPFVEPVRRALALKGLAFELQEDAAAGDPHSPESGLPVAEIAGERVRELAEILLRIERLRPRPPLLSEDPRAAAAQLQLARWVSETFSWYWSRSLRAGGGAGLETGSPSSSSPGSSHPREPPRPKGVSLRDWLGRRLRNPEPGAPERVSLAYEIGHRVDDLARLLGDRDFFYGDRLGLADLIVHGALSAVAADRIPGTALHLERHPRLGRFIRRVDRAAEDGAVLQRRA